MPYETLYKTQNYVYLFVFYTKTLKVKGGIIKKEYY